MKHALEAFTDYKYLAYLRYRRASKAAAPENTLPLTLVTDAVVDVEAEHADHGRNQRDEDHYQHRDGPFVARTRSETSKIQFGRAKRLTQ